MYIILENVISHVYIHENVSKRQSKIENCFKCNEYLIIFHSFHCIQCSVELILPHKILLWVTLLNSNSQEASFNMKYIHVWCRCVEIMSRKLINISTSFWSKEANFGDRAKNYTSCCYFHNCFISSWIKVS